MLCIIYIFCLFYSVRRTQVIDDECDYFSTDSNQWLNKEDREALRKREEELRAARFASRKDRKVGVSDCWTDMEVVKCLSIEVYLQRSHGRWEWVIAGPTWK